MLTDLRQALRIFAKAPGFTLLIVIALAIGIGAATSISGTHHADLTA